MARVVAARPNIMVRVVPNDDAMRRLLKHPAAGGFRAQGAANWPNDRYTKRRLEEGSIKLESDEKKHEGDKPKPQGGPQHQRGGEAA